MIHSLATRKVGYVLTLKLFKLDQLNFLLTFYYQDVLYGDRDASLSTQLKFRSGAILLLNAAGWVSFFTIPYWIVDLNGYFTVKHYIRNQISNLLNCAIPKMDQCVNEPRMRTKDTTSSITEMLTSTKQHHSGPELTTIVLFLFVIIVGLTAAYFLWIKLHFPKKTSKLQTISVIDLKKKRQRSSSNKDSLYKDKRHRTSNK